MNKKNKIKEINLKPEIICHIGYPKTASTTIQHNYFAKAKDTTYISRANNSGDSRFTKQYEIISNAIATGRKIPLAKKEWLNILNETKTSKIVFSDERITLPRNSNILTVIERASNVKKIFGSAKILVILREPYSFLRSLYQHSSIEKYSNTKILPIAFDNWLGEELELSKYTKGHKCQSLHFGEVLIEYSRLFKRENLGVFFLEDLKGDSLKFYNDISTFLNYDTEIAKVANSEDARNVTSKRHNMQYIIENITEFENPIFPQKIKKEADQIIERNKLYMKNILNIDTSLVWS